MKVEDVKKITVLGAGVMGHGIAMTCARTGFQTTMVDVSKDLIDKGYDLIRNGQFGLMRLVDKGKMAKDEMEAIIARIKGTTDPAEGAEDADIVIEAIAEIPDLKKKVWKEYDRLCPDRTIFASNTSTIMITEQASATNRPDRFVGMHWFNPAQVMRLIEVIRGALTSDETFRFIVDLSNKLGKVPVEAADSPGFFTSRFIGMVMMSAIRLFEQGIAGIKEIDTMCKLGFGFPMGPFELMDLTGLDVGMHAGEYIYDITGDVGNKPPLTLKKMVSAGYIGKKAGSKGGWYDYYKISK